MQCPTGYRLVPFIAVAIYLLATLNASSQPVVATGAPADDWSIANAKGNAAEKGPGRGHAGGTGPFFQWGTVGLRPSVQYQMVYADGLNAQPGRAGSSYIQSFTGALALGNDRWKLIYSPSFVTYSSPAFRDTLSQFASIEGALLQPGWSAFFNQQYAQSDTPLVESGRQTGEETSTTNVGASWLLSDLTLGISANQSLNFIENMTDTFSWAVQPSANYRFGDVLTVGVGASLGYVLVYHASDLASIRPTANIEWHVTQKTSFNVAVGYEDWKFISGHKQSLTGLYYQGSISWQPFQSTTITASAGQSNSTAPFQDQASRNHTYSVALTQRLFTHFQLNLSADNQRTDYLLSAATLQTARGDRIRSYSARLGTTFLGRGTVAIFYTRSQNISSDPGYGFSSGQIGFDVGYSY